MKRAQKPRTPTVPPDPEMEMSIACPSCAGREHHPGTVPVCAACGAPMERAYFLAGVRVDARTFREALMRR